MTIEIVAPSPGESITEVEVGRWLVEDGDLVEKDQEIAEIESDKATLPVVAEQSGRIKILVPIAENVAIGTVLCTIDTTVKPGGKKNKEKANEPPVLKQSADTDLDHSGNVTIKENRHTVQESGKVRISPVAGKMMQEHGLSVDDIMNDVKRISKKDVETVLSTLRTEPSLSKSSSSGLSREEEKIRMTSLRRKLSERLVAVKNETAMLTTFNEADMSEVIRLRKTYQTAFVEKHGVKLGFMSFFTKAVTEALLLFPHINSRIDGENIITPKYCDIGIAVQSDKGLMVPVLRNTEVMTLAEIERKILELADKARANRLSIQEMTGGTFSITNGGVFGSLLSTPILNPPQSAILGMHNIVERPVAVDGRIEIRPMMYLALSYDHRLIDGKDSVSFLVKIKEMIENPVKLLFNGADPEKVLLDI
ncbi:MAG: 2-oxoglutarate dehydrogenase [Bacteroides sp. SM23_62_1]|nr:MAG: 2-oxoglutarate dehydrogenase [Bacteroides sp. SM23_62_1]